MYYEPLGALQSCIVNFFVKLVHHFVFRLTADDIREGAIIPLSFVKFQNVSSVTVSILIIFGWFRS